MNTPPSDTEEGTIDIFVLTRSSDNASLLKEYLEQRGFCLTLFNDGPQLTESLRFGKPNLLISDTTSVGDEGFEVCRQIKADDDLWMIPVMIITGASALTDLLRVLDCNADNFIAYPYDAQYLLSLVDVMLVTPVERQTPELVKTQFKIQHDERVYVVMAGRRKLLEMLLSAYEIAVNKSSELDRVSDELQKLSAVARRLEESVNEHTRVIDIMNSGIRQKEIKEKALVTELAEKEKVINNKTGEITRLNKDLEEGRTLLETAEKRIQSVLEEKEKTVAAFSSEADTFRQQVAELTNDRNALVENLDRTRHSFDEEKARRAATDGALKKMTAEKEQLETSLQGLTAEYEKTASALSDKTAQFLEAEQEISSLRLAKDKTEQDLKRIVDELKRTIDDLKTTSGEQLAEIARLHAELGTAKNRCMATEDQLVALRLDKDRSETELHSAVEELKGEYEELRAKLDSAIAALEEKKCTIKALDENFALVAAEKADLQSAITTLSDKYTAMKAAFEEEETRRRSAEEGLAGATADREKSEKTIQSLTGTLREVQKALAAEQDQRTTAEKDLAAAREGRKSAEKTITDMAGTLEETKASLAAEKDKRRISEEQLNTIILEREETIQAHREAHDAAKTDLDEHRQKIALLSRDIEDVSAIRSTLEKDLDIATSRIHALEKELYAALKAKTLSGEQSRYVIEDLEKVRSDLENEKKLRYAAEENLNNAVKERSRSEAELQRSAGELTRLSEALEAGDRKRKDAERNAEAAIIEKERILEDFRVATLEREEQDKDMSAQVRSLNEELSTARARQQSLEEQVQTLTLEKMLAEQKLESLTAEIQQARAALADEWEDHMTADERLAAAVEEKEHLEQSLKQAEELSAIRQKKEQSLVAKEPKTPAVYMPAPLVVAPVEKQKTAITDDRAPSAPLTPPGEETDHDIPDKTEHESQEVPTITSVEDLFEPHPVAEDETTGQDAGKETKEEKTEPAAGEASLDLIETADKELTDAEGGQVSQGGPVRTLDEFGAYSPARGSFTFSRQQWLDLLKWAHHSGALSLEQRMQIVRMGRLAQRGRKLTKKQEEQVREMIALVQASGYRFT